MDFIFIDEGFDLSFSANQQLFTEPPYAVQFTNTTPNLETTISHGFWRWYHSQSNNLNVFHEYSASGSFSITLSATDLLVRAQTTLLRPIIFIYGMASNNEHHEISYQLSNPSSNKINIKQIFPYNKFVIYDQQGREMLKGLLTGTHTEVSLKI